MTLALVHRGDAEHGVDRLARTVAASAAVRASGAVLALPHEVVDGARAHVHFTDRLWGASPEASADAIEALAIAIANYVTLLDPELVVIGGGMAAAGDDLFRPLRARLAAHMRFGDPPPVVAAALGEDAGRHGAAIAAWRAAGMEESELASWEV